jgi:hypothetical protein
VSLTLCTCVSCSGGIGVVSMCALHCAKPDLICTVCACKTNEWPHFTTAVHLAKKRVILDLHGLRVHAIKRGCQRHAREAHTDFARGWEVSTYRRNSFFSFSRSLLSGCFPPCVLANVCLWRGIGKVRSKSPVRMQIRSLSHSLALFLTRPEH